MFCHNKLYLCKMNYTYLLVAVIVLLLILWLTDHCRLIRERKQNELDRQAQERNNEAARELIQSLKQSM